MITGVSLAASLFMTKSSPGFMFSIIFSLASIDWIAVFLLNFNSGLAPANAAIPNSGFGLS